MYKIKNPLKMRYSLLGILLVIASLVTSCGGYQALLKSDDYEKKYDAAVMYFDQEEYHKALPLLEDLMSYIRGTERTEDVYYYYAKSLYETGDLRMASFRFLNLFNTYPHGKYAQEALFMHAFCLYRMSPPVELDQDNSKKAIDAFQSYINRFPTSDKIEQCNQYIDELMRKIERKAVRNAKLYHHMEEHKAAITALGTVLEEYPGLPMEDELYYLRVESAYKLFAGSIWEKKEERYHDVIRYYKEMKRNVPEDSKFLNLARSYSKDAESDYKKFLMQQSKIK